MSGVVYVFFLLLVLCFVMGAFELCTVNCNLKEIKELSNAENNRVKKRRKS